MYYDSQDTIVALSTPSGSSLYAIIRISGPDALFCAKEIFIPATGNQKGYTSLVQIDTKFAVFQSLKGNVHLPHEQIEIPSTLYIMRAPRSYTREDVVEIHTFGSPPLLDMIIESLLSLKPTSKVRHVESASGVSCVRLAQPGEFTKRAFLNGRIDLTQAEAVIGLIRSRTDAELKTAHSILKGELSKKVKEIQQSLVECCAEIEASIDFSDQDIEIIIINEITERLDKIHEKLDNFLNHAVITSSVHSDGVKTVLCGRPNVGKSSLFNALLGRRQAIVTPVPGTTRDVLEGALELGNIRFQLLDTAGVWNETSLTQPSSHWGEGKGEGVVELASLAVAKTHESLQMSQLILFVLDGSKRMVDEDIELFNSFPSSQRIIVINKCDIATHTPLYPLLIEGTKAGVASLPSKKRGTGGVSPLSDDFKRYPIVRTSAITGEGLDDLKSAMVRTILEGRIDQSASDVTLNARHKAAFKRTLGLIKSAKEAAAQARSYEFIALDLREALETLGEVVGETTTEDILDKIFSDFCIGK